MADASLAELLSPSGILLDRKAADYEDAVRQVGAVLVELGAVAADYVETMLDRERSVSTFVGEGVAIPHGTLAGRDFVRRDSLCVLQYPDGVDWQGEDVVLCIGIAAKGEGHVPILAQLADLLMEPDRAAALRAASSADEVIRLLTPDADDADEAEDGSG